ncbi:chromate efflux transporter [Oceanimonas pelagia]|uniref:Chromate efflux transporter n=1 Tax=Oceanimonas pelagia TaxID=3028314 RepID=A0AA50KPE0_9GAMM|nr:chromate efflux transporter [Oceanimonas pelagia]WMC11263.1 chromate efflux transporter [Oceanimonas pelagia]
MLSVFWQFFMLGWVSFGGPAAHIGYFQRHFVQKLGWLPQERFAATLALCQFLPGPASSQLGFAIGYQRAGLGGAIAAFVGFTLPSFVLMLALALLGRQYAGSAITLAVVSGLKLFALVVVADAVLTMAGQFCRQRLPLTLAVATAAGQWLWPGLAAQFAALLTAALIGALWLRRGKGEPGHSPVLNWPFLLLFAGLFLLLPLVTNTASARLFADFYQAGSLVFGGGHVVLPLLQNLLADELSSEAFLTGYAAAQAMPGPMFSLAAFLGAELLPASPLTGALVATFGVFLPGFLLVLALLNGWQTLASNPRMAGAIAGVNASVVGLLLAALYQPVFVASITGAPALAAAALGLLALRVFRCPLLVLIPAFMLLGFWL